MSTMPTLAEVARRPDISWFTDEELAALALLEWFRREGMPGYCPKALASAVMAILDARRERSLKC